MLLPRYTKIGRLRGASAQTSDGREEGGQREEDPMDVFREQGVFGDRLLRRWPSQMRTHQAG